MGLMTQFQKQKKADPAYGAGSGERVAVVGAGLASSAIGKQQALANIERGLAEDLEKLKLIKSVKQKEREKAEHLVPKYLSVVDSMIKASLAHPLIGQILVWLFDVKDIHNAMRLAMFCIENNIPMPERFKRDLPTYLCDVVTEWAEAELEAGRTVEPYFQQVMDFAQGFDLPDQVTAKMYRLAGLVAMKNENYQAAVDHLTTATEYGAKVKTVLAEAQKKAASQPDA